MKLVTVALLVLLSACQDKGSGIQHLNSDRQGLAGTWYSYSQPGKDQWEKIAFEFGEKNFTVMVKAIFLEEGETDETGLIRIVGTYELSGETLKLSTTKISEDGQKEKPYKTNGKCEVLLGQDLQLDCNVLTEFGEGPWLFKRVQIGGGKKLDFDTVGELFGSAMPPTSPVDPGSSSDSVINQPIATEYKTENLKYRSYLLNRELIHRKLRRAIEKRKKGISEGNKYGDYVEVNVDFDLIPLAQEDHVIDFSVEPPLYSAPIPQAVYPEKDGIILRMVVDTCHGDLMERYERTYSGGHLSAELKFELKVWGGKKDDYWMDHSSEYLDMVAAQCLPLFDLEIDQLFTKQKFALHATLAN